MIYVPSLELTNVSFQVNKMEEKVGNNLKKRKMGKTEIL